MELRDYRTKGGAREDEEQGNMKRRYQTRENEGDEVRKLVKTIKKRGGNGINSRVRWSFKAEQE